MYHVFADISIEMTEELDQQLDALYDKYERFQDCWTRIFQEHFGERYRKCRRKYYDRIRVNFMKRREAVNVEDCA